MDLALLATLKDKLVHAKEFSKVWAYFLDHFGEDPAFIALGERADDPFLKTVLAEVGRQLFQKDVDVSEFLLTRLPEQQFLHGGGMLNGKLANVLYFEDVHAGLLAVILSFSPADTRFIRFSGQVMKDSWKRSQN